MSQSRRLSHLETLTQNIVGQLLAFVILWAYSIPLTTSISMQVTFLLVAYTRGYLIRRLFEHLARRLQ